MKNKILDNKLRVILLALCSILILTTLTCIPIFTTKAEYSGKSGTIDRGVLHNETVATSVTVDMPAITILTPGLGRGAEAWSNNMEMKEDKTWTNNAKFVEDSDSLIEKMRKESSSNLKLYRAISINKSSFNLYIEYGDSDSDIVTKIDNFSSHTVIVIELDTTWEAMENVYERLHYIIDKISYDYYKIYNKLPRLNLIGHSMGGLLNMQYAIDHPKNVAALVSLGTPYNGSWYDNWFVELIGIKSFNEQPCIACTCGHDYYFCNLETRRSKWNSIYSKNKHIKFYALSGETSKSLMNYIVLYDHYLTQSCGEATATAVKVAYKTIAPLNLFLSVLPGDVCVDTNSQKAVGYDGVINYNKEFTISNSNVKKRSQCDFPVPHNLEAYDSDMHNVI